MDAYEIVRHLNQVLDLCDSLDQSGEIGVIGLTRPLVHPHLLSS